MTQLEFDVIMKLIENGAPALAHELCGSLNDLVNDYNKLRTELAARNEADDTKVSDAE